MVDLVVGKGVVDVEDVVFLDEDAGVFHVVPVIIADLSGAEPVDEDMHLDAGGGASGEGVGELFAGGSGPVDVGFEGDGVLGGVDGVEHGGEYLVAVD